MTCSSCYTITGLYVPTTILLNGNEYNMHYLFIDGLTMRLHVQEHSLKAADIIIQMTVSSIRTLTFLKSEILSALHETS
jgi:hypothetical protein